MSDAINVLQLGGKNWAECFQLPKNLIWNYTDVLQKIPKHAYDIVFLDRTVTDTETLLLQKATKAYTLFVTEDVEYTEAMQILCKSKVAKILPRDEIERFLLEESRNYFPKSYGEKFDLNNLSVAQDFQGKVDWDGNYCVTLEGDFGNELHQAVFWRNTVPIFEGQAVELWLEYETEGDVEISLEATHFFQGTISSIQQKWCFDENALGDVVVLDNQMSTGQVFFSILAKGSGTLRIIALHDRHSRRGHGTFLPGGERYVTSNREEIFAYFDPGDMKPPLNVYFSGYKTLQGFEGYYMLRKLGCPFLLITEPRLEGGCCYMGEEEYENLLVQIIRETMAKLNFSSQEVILSGLSMGTFGALYYGCDIVPHAMIVGKPVVSIGNIAANERLHRPGVFPTSLDMLRLVTGEVTETAVQTLNDKFWRKFKRVDWEHSKFIVAYMLEDDYDGTAYNDILSHIHGNDVQVYGKGIHGRHNDDTGSVVGWFISQYHRVLKEDFGRRIEK